MSKMMALKKMIQHVPGENLPVLVGRSRNVARLLLRMFGQELIDGHQCDQIFEIERPARKSLLVRAGPWSFSS
jgi:hypothetical protein